MPNGFDFPAGADSWTRLSFGKERPVRSVNVVARIKAGVTFEHARAEMDSIEAALSSQYPVENAGWRVEMALHDAIVGDVRPSVWLLYAAVSLVLFIAVTNAAGVVLARGKQLERDMAVRVALGATVGRLRRGQLFECALLAAIAGAIGFAIADATVRVMIALAPSSVPRLQEITTDMSTVFACGGLAAGVALLLWLLTAIGVQSTPQALTTGGRQAGSATSSTARSVLTAVQVAFCVALWP